MAPSHAVLSPSSAHRWMECTGSMAFAENTSAGTSSDFADEGTAAHTLMARALTEGKACESYIGWEIKPHPKSKVYTVDEEMASNVQAAIDEVLRHCGPDTIMLVEQRVDISEAVGQEEQFGTADVVLIHPSKKAMDVCDLKYGRGEKVDANWNHQLLLYAAGAVHDNELMYDIESMQLHILQPRLDHYNTFPPTYPLTRNELRTWLDSKREACANAAKALVMSEAEVEQAGWLKPGVHTCRWCNVKGRCPALAKYVEKHVAADFEVLDAKAPVVPVDTGKLGLALQAVPIIEEWCRAVVAKAMEVVQAGVEVRGSDGLPLKLVQGRQGNRAWKDEKAAEEVLLGQLGPAAYQPQKIITAGDAAKKFNKKKTQALWDEVFEPLIKRAAGKPMLALGSDPRPPYTGAALEGEFEEISDDLTS